MAAMSTLHATYRLTCSANDIAQRAQALALEQSIEMPLEAVSDPQIQDLSVAEVIEITPRDEQQFDVIIALKLATIGAEAGQLLNMLFGNCSLQEDVRLVDIEFPAALGGMFPGPRHGMAGIRATLGVPARALTCTALKPQGLSPAALAALCATFASAGIDIIKDDHGIANQAYAPFVPRVRACQRALREVISRTGKKVIYAPSLSGSPRQLHAQLEFAREEEIEMALVSPMIMGIPTFRELVDEHPAMMFMAHPALSGALRIAPPLFYGKLFRLFGADAVIFPNFGGRFSFSRDTCHDLVAGARAAWANVKPALPVPAGGMSVARVPEMLTAYGADSMLLIGGGLLSAGDALFERSQQFVEAVQFFTGYHA